MGDLKPGGQAHGPRTFLLSPANCGGARGRLLFSDRANSELAQRLRNEAGLESVFPVESNAVFVQLDDELVRDLHARGWRFYKSLEPDIYRLMCSWSTTGEEVSMLVADFVAIK